MVGILVIYYKINLKGVLTLGVDLNLDALVEGQKKYPNLLFKQGNIEKLNYFDDNFDTIFAIEVIEHLLDIDRSFSEVYRVLKKEGYFCITTTDFNWLKKVIIATFI